MLIIQKLQTLNLANKQTNGYEKNINRIFALTNTQLLSSAYPSVEVMGYVQLQLDARKSP